MLKKQPESGSPLTTVQTMSLTFAPSNVTSQAPQFTSNPTASSGVGRRPKILLLAEQCNPDWASVPLLSYRLFHEISQLVDVTLVTHGRNKAALQDLQEAAEIIYIEESNFSKQYYKVINSIINRGKTIWPLQHMLTYPVYAEFNHKAYQRLKHRVQQGEFDLVHALTPMEPRYPIKLSKACQDIPFVLGPVNGGVPFPKGFQEKARQEFAQLNFLRAVGRWLLPDYVKTYKKATRILAGSTYTRQLIQQMFKLPEDRLELFYENGIPESFLIDQKPQKLDSTLHLLFVGRLVPYKCADILLEALARLDATIRAQLKLTIVGDGSEKKALVDQVQQLGLTQLVQFAGWVKQSEIAQFYRNADIFCFPSIREYGGGVVIEAMAAGLPCIVANNGGIGEYVTDQTGFRIEPISREYLTQELADKIQLLFENQSLRQEMSANAIQRVREFTWKHKAQHIVNLYHTLIAEVAIPSQSQGVTSV